MRQWSKLTLLVLSSLSMIALTGCSLFSPAPVVQSERIVRIPPEKPEPLSRPDLELKVLVPSNVDRLYVTPPTDGAVDDFTYIMLSWQDFLSLAQYMEEVKFKIGEYIRIIDYWEQGNEAPEEE